VHLPDELDFVLRDLARRRQVDITLLRNDQGCWTLDSTQRKRLIDAVSDEFALTGLDANDEPNARGLILEDILDRLNVIM